MWCCDELETGKRKTVSELAMDRRSICPASGRHVPYALALTTDICSRQVSFALLILEAPRCSLQCAFIGFSV